jgi:signal transduction histidine kinase
VHVPPSQWPLFDPATLILHDGSTVPACSFCKKAITSKPECKSHYESLTRRPDGFYQCPFGFTSRSFRFLGKIWVITGVVAHPRFDTEDERRLAKSFPDTRVARAAIDAVVRFFEQLERAQADSLEQSAKVLPQAFHELRKLNAAVLQYAEKELRTNPNAPNLMTIESAAELMRNSFDILEAVSNIEGMRALPRNSTISLYDLLYKVKKVYEVRANERHMRIDANGCRAIIRGSTKAFPMVLTILLENAIKYGKPNSTITANITASDRKAIVKINNLSDYYIDPTKCFERGVRFAPSTEGGGFGLFLAREVVDCHNGTIRCEIEPDGSITMVVTVPLEKVAADRQYLA